MAKLKTQDTNESVLAYVEGLGHKKRQEDAYIIMDMMKEITGLEPRMWGPSIIGYGSCHYTYDSGHEGDMPLISFSPRKPKQVLYILNNYEGQEAFLEKLGKYKRGKVCLYVNKLEDIDLDLLKKMMIASYQHNKENFD